MSAMADTPSSGIRNGRGWQVGRLILWCIMVSWDDPNYLPSQSGL